VGGNGRTERRHGRPEDAEPAADAELAADLDPAAEAELAADLELAAEAARLAGIVVLQDFGGEHRVTHKGPDQPLTGADLAADRLLREVLGAARPGYGWLSEETADRPDRLRCDRVWIVDPIDGTRSYISGRPEFAISIGLAVAGAAVVGVVYNPGTGELFRCVRGGGAWLDGRAGALRVRPAGAPRVLVASRTEIAAGELDPFADVAVVPLGSTAYKLARIAAGEADVFLSRGPKSEWDVCAGALLVEEAGGRATDLAGRMLRYNRPDPEVDGIVATNGAGHDELIARLAGLPAVRRRRPEGEEA
jgi:myo-inositol-1(or 4)-monophosphatase